MVISVTNETDQFPSDILRKNSNCLQHPVSDTSTSCFGNAAASLGPISLEGKSPTFSKLQREA